MNTEVGSGLKHICGLFLVCALLVMSTFGVPLTEIEDEADIAWNARSVEIPSSWKGKRVFLVIEACGWVDGEPLGAHRGGYKPFEFELAGETTPRMLSLARGVAIYGERLGHYPLDPTPAFVLKR